MPSALTCSGVLPKASSSAWANHWPGHVVVPAQRIEETGEGNEVAGNEPRALVDQLVEGVLPVGQARPINRPRVVVDGGRRRTLLPLLSMVSCWGRREARGMVVGQNRLGLNAEESSPR